MNVCTSPVCDRPAKTRGLCGAHAERARKGQPIDTPVRPRLSFDQSYAVAESGCWEWHGGMSTAGYGRFRHQYAHRISYELHKGPIPEGLHVDHLCRNTRCINPDHLEAVTPRENCLRGTSPPAQQAQQTHCKRGHELSGANVYRKSSKPNKRECRTCVLAAQRARYAARRAA